MTTEVIAFPSRSEREVLFSDLNKPSLENLSYVLRHPETWPKGFVWKYSDCDQCAMGLAHRLWSEHIERTSADSGASVMARAFAMPYTDAKNIFMGKGEWVPYKEVIRKKRKMLFFKEIESGYQTDYDSVTPEMVADQIDEYLLSVR